jgi:hypothetical protein
MLLFAIGYSYGEISHSITFKKEKLILKEKLTDKGPIVMVDYEDFIKYGLDGAPALPYKILTFYISDNECDLELVVDELDADTLFLNGCINSLPKSTPTSILNTVDYGNNKYMPSSLYPNSIVEVIHDDYVSGSNRFIKIKVSPLQYSEENEFLLFYNNIKFSIKSKDSVNKKTSMPLHSFVKKNDSWLEKSIKIENYNDWKLKDTPTNKTNKILSSKITSSINLPVYNYIIITSSEFASCFDRLVNWKKLKGVSAGVVCLQEILNDSSITGDQVSGIYDEAGKLRQYLTYAWERGAEYVLLAGQDSIVPVRYGVDGNCQPGESVNFYYRIPNDWYYCDLNGNWNVDGDEHYGETSHDNIDYGAELYVGRILCKNTTEINNYIDKILIYEQNPGAGDFGYLRKAFFTTSDQMQYGGEAESIISLMQSDSLFSTNDLYKETPNYNSPSPDFPYGNDVITKMEERYGFFSWFGHGNVDGITTSSNLVNNSPWHGISSVDAFNGGYVEEVNNGLDVLTNDNYPAIAYTVACSSMPYDKYNYYHGSVDFSFGESFTVAGKYGGPIYLGNTRYGWVGSSKNLFAQFITALDDADYHFGKAEAFSKNNFTSSLKHYLTYSHNLLGCPESQLWTDIPSAITDINISQSGDSLSVSSSDECTFTVNGLFGDDIYHDHSTGISASFEGIPVNFIVSATKHNSFVYIAPLYLQNEVVTGDHYIYANEVSIGNSVASGRPTGNFVVSDTAAVILNTSESVNIADGFEVELGGSFEIINR